MYYTINKKNLKSKNINKINFNLYHIGIGCKCIEFYFLYIFI